MPLPPTKEHLEAFNDLALEWVVPARLEGKGEAFWLGELEEAPKQPEQDQRVDEAADAVEKLSLGGA